MKNIQVIDGAMNCLYLIYGASDDDFAVIFPAGRDIEFADDLFARLGDDAAQALTERLWSKPVDKKQVLGIHGTLFYGLDFKKRYFPTKVEAEAVTLP